VKQKYQQLKKILGKEEIKKIKVDEPMDKHTSFRIGGPADLFLEANTESKFIRSVKAFKKTKTPFFILGRGTNLLVSDKGFRGVVIKRICPKASVKKQKIIADSHLALNDLVNFACNHSLSGLENLTGIPGSVGGAIRGNAGAWRTTISDLVSRVKILDEKGKVFWINKKDCQFSYRESRFKKGSKIILSAEFELEKKSKSEIKRVIREITKKRENLPCQPSAGCIFINPETKPAGWLIEQAGLKGKKIGQAQISPIHANFIVNLGKARAKDVVRLISLARKRVREKFNLDLTEEIVKLGDF